MELEGLFCRETIAVKSDSLEVAVFGVCEVFGMVKERSPASQDVLLGLIEMHPKNHTLVLLLEALSALGS